MPILIYSPNVLGGMMGLFSTIFRTIKMATTGTVVRRIDMPIMDGNCTMSLRLKHSKDGKRFVVLAGIGSGSYQYFPMDPTEFDDFAAAVTAINAELVAGDGFEPPASRF